MRLPGGQGHACVACAAGAQGSRDCPPAAAQGACSFGARVACRQGQRRKGLPLRLACGLRARQACMGRRVPWGGQGAGWRCRGRRAVGHAGRWWLRCCLLVAARCRARCQQLWRMGGLQAGPAPKGVAAAAGTRAAARQTYGMGHRVPCSGLAAEGGAGHVCRRACKHVNVQKAKPPPRQNPGACRARQVCPDACGEAGPDLPAGAGAWAGGRQLGQAGPGWGLAAGRSACGAGARGPGTGCGLPGWLPGGAGRAGRWGGCCEAGGLWLKGRRWPCAGRGGLVPWCPLARRGAARFGAVGVGRARAVIPWVRSRLPCPRRRRRRSRFPSGGAGSRARAGRPGSGGFR